SIFAFLLGRFDVLINTATPSVTNAPPANPAAIPYHLVLNNFAQSPSRSIFSPVHALASLYGRSCKNVSPTLPPTAAMPTPSEAQPHGRLGRRLGTFSSS